MELTYLLEELTAVSFSFLSLDLLQCSFSRILKFCTNKQYSAIQVKYRLNLLDKFL